MPHNISKNRELSLYALCQTDLKKNDSDKKLTRTCFIQFNINCVKFPQYHEFLDLLLLANFDPFLDFSEEK